MELIGFQESMLAVKRVDDKMIQSIGYKRGKMDFPVLAKLPTTGKLKKQ
jgi:hypothetical protein